MSTKSRNQLRKNIKNKAYRDAFVEEHIGTGLSFQIRGIRTKLKLSQKQLAARIGTKQEAISRLENPDYGQFTLETLKKLASTFDVALIVRFVPFSELIDKVTSLSPRDLVVPDFANDEGLNDLGNAPALAERRSTQCLTCSLNDLH